MTLTKKPLFPQDNEKDSETLLKKRLRMDKYFQVAANALRVSEVRR